MALEVLWTHDCPGHIETQVVNGVIQVICYVEETPTPPPTRVTNGLQVLYNFDEGVGTSIGDSSGVGTPLNLTVEGEGVISWLPAGGLAVDSPALIASSGAATKLIAAVTATHEISIESWLKPASLTQDGPARIVTLSADYHHCDFGLAQASEAYDVRLRTTETTENGRPSLATPSGAAVLTMTHLMFTRASTGSAAIYLNGSEVANKTVGGNLSNWDPSYRLALANELIGGRAWLGEFRLVAVYNRALSAAEVDQNFRAGLVTGL